MKKVIIRCPCNLPSFHAMHPNAAVTPSYKSPPRKSHIRQFSQNWVGCGYLMAVMGLYGLLWGLWPCCIKFVFERKSEKSNATWLLTNQNRALRICVWFFWSAFKRKFYATGPYVPLFFVQNLSWWHFWNRSLWRCEHDIRTCEINTPTITLWLISLPTWMVYHKSTSIRHFEQCNQQLSNLICQNCDGSIKILLDVGNQQHAV